MTEPPQGSTPVPAPLDAPAGEPPVPGPSAPTWGIPRIVLYSVLVAVATVVAQTVLIVTMSAIQVILHPNLDVRAWTHDVATNGFVFALSTLTGAAVAIPLLLGLVSIRESRPLSFLGVRRCAARSVLAACAGAAALAAGSDLLSWSLGRPLVPPFVAQTYATALSLPLMVLATVIAAPFMEELFFRGFLLSALGVRGVPPLVSGVLVSFVWAAIHAQYDLYGIGTIFVTGLLFSAVRFRYDSIVPTIAMHALVNTAAFVEAAIAARVSH